MNIRTGKTFSQSQKICNKIASLAIEAMLFEVSATPKPGLVDRNNCGAHKDMNFYTFMSSVAALHSVFDEMAFAGIKFSDSDIKNTFLELRKIGIMAEKLMFSATNNINTHKGEIFSLGILCGCVGRLIAGNEFFNVNEILNLSKSMCRGICENDFADIKRKDELTLTKGEKIFLKFGIKGIRGESESGYKTVKDISLPVFEDLISRNININDALVQTLLYLISETTDTNIISRHDIKTAEYAKDYAKKVIAHGGIFTNEGRNLILEMDNDFNEKYISPGGCCDLLAVTYFLYYIPSKIFACS